MAKDKDTAADMEVGGEVRVPAAEKAESGEIQLRLGE